MLRIYTLKKIFIMDNIFKFEYEVEPLKNKNETESRFAVVYGKDGKIIHCKKNSYEIIPTNAMHGLAQAFISRYGVSAVTSFIHKDGEVIGLNVSLTKGRTTLVGDKDYRAVITVPNNGGGRGYLAIKEKRLICSNGMTRSKTVHEVKSIRIPHTLNYQESIHLMEQSVVEFGELVDYVERMDGAMDSMKLETSDVMFHLNKWFYEKEMPLSHKEDMTFEDFRRLLYENPGEIKTLDRYHQLQEAFKRERKNNRELNLDLSMYTVFASVTNYLSRRLEKSGSKAPEEVKSERQSAKLTYFDKLVTV